MQHSKIGRSTSGVGQKQRGPSEPVAGACPKCPESRHSSMMAADGSHGPAGSRGSGGRAQRGMGCDASISLSPVEAAWPRQAARAARWRVILGRRHLGGRPAPAGASSGVHSAFLVDTWLSPPQGGRGDRQPVVLLRSATARRFALR